MLKLVLQLTLHSRGLSVDLALKLILFLPNLVNLPIFVVIEFFSLKRNPCGSIDTVLIALWELTWSLHLLDQGLDAARGIHRRRIVLPEPVAWRCRRRFEDFLSRWAYRGLGIHERVASSDRV